MIISVGIKQLIDICPNPRLPLGQMQLKYTLFSFIGWLIIIVGVFIEILVFEFPYESCSL